MNPKEMLSLFVTAKSAAGRSPRTIRWYKDLIQNYLDWTEAHGLGKRWMKAETIDAFLAHERWRTPRLSNSSILARYRALSAWFGWMVLRRYIKRSPLDIVERPQVPDGRIEHVTEDEYRQVLASIDRITWVDYRDYAIIQVLFWCGLRRSECAHLHVADINFNEGTVHVRTGKGGKSRTVPVLHDVQKSILNYLDQRPDWDGPELWLGQDTRTHAGPGGPLASNGVRLMLERRSNAAGLRRLHAHAWRHGFAMAMLNNGAEMSSVSTMLGHSSVKITADLYARWLMAGLKREYMEAANRILAARG